MLGATAGGILCGWSIGKTSARAWAVGAPITQSQVALAANGSRSDNVHNALKLIEHQVKQGIARKKRVVVKPNMVVLNRQLAASHVDCVEAIVDFVSAFYKDEIIIADSPASGVVTEGYENYGYYRIQKKHKVKFLDLDEEPTTLRQVSDHRFMPRDVRMSTLLLDPDTYIISAAMPKTHDRAVVTLSLKNIVVGAAKKDSTFRWGPDSKGNNDKTFIHGGPANEAINLNLFQLARQLRPHLAVLDGYEGMEHNGPVSGTPVEHRIAVAGTDWLAVDRVGVELMGFDFNKVGYLKFAAEHGMGEGDLARIEVLGEQVAGHVRSYKPHDKIEQQYKWMTRHSREA
jgi:uncharacterized protein (DUF362 family)